MMMHSFVHPKDPKRVIVLGAGGFIGGAILRCLAASGVRVLGLARCDIDLVRAEAATSLSTLLEPDDVVVVTAAKAPCKDLAMMCENLVMIEAVCKALQKVQVAHVVYVSSDAVYRDSADPLIEESCAEPSSLHGAMHLTREIALQNVFSGPLALIRPTLVYGSDDPHNGYGPNRFRRLALAGKDIVLFGNGEERRDHVDVNDVAELVRLTILRRTFGIANAVSGEVVSFRELAEFASSEFLPRVGVITTPRTGPMPHNGHRPFDNSAVRETFPELKFKRWREGLAAVHAKQRSQERA